MKREDGLYLLAFLVACAALAGRPGACGEAPGGWVPLPRGLAPGPARIRLTVGGKPLVFEFPARGLPAAGEVLDFEAAPDIRLRLARAKPAASPPGAAGTTPFGDVWLSCLVLSGGAKADVDVDVDVEADFPGFARARPARFNGAEGAGVALLSTRGGGVDAAQGFYDAATDLGVDLGRVDPALTVQAAASPQARLAGGRRISIRGRVPRGRETVLFSRRPVRRVLGTRSSAARSLRMVERAGYLGGWLLPGGRDLAAKAKALRKHHPELEGAYVEIGDGWQVRRRGRRWFRGPARNWHSALDDGTAGEVIGALEQLGFRPGLWIVPHGQGDKAVFEEHPGAFLRDETGAAVSDGFLGAYVVDGTSRQGLEYLRDLFAKLAATGAPVLRLGGLREALEAYRRGGDYLADPTVDPLQVVRATLVAMRRGCGEDVVLAGDWDTPPELAGLIDAAIPVVGAGAGADILWAQGLAAAGGYFRHRGSWWAESLPVLEGAGGSSVPAAIRDAECRALSSRVLLAALTGRGLLVDGDLVLPPPVDALWRTAWPPLEVFSVDLFPSASPVPAWDLKVGGDGAGGDVLGLFNWSVLESSQVRLTPDDLCLSVASGQRHVLWDVLEGRLAGVAAWPLDVFLQPAESRLFTLVDLREHPAVLGVRGDPGQSARLLSETVWDGGKLTLSGTVRLARADSRPVLAVAAPRGYELLGAEAEGGRAEVAGRHGFFTVRVKAQRAGKLPFVVRFKRREEAPVGDEIPPPSSFRVSFLANERLPLLDWTAGDESLSWWSAVEGFSILRNGREIGRTTDHVFLDVTATDEAAYSYAVQARVRPGTAPAERQKAPSLASAAVTWSFPPARDVFLDTCTMSALPSGTSRPALRRSVLGGPLSIGGRKFERGIGTRAPSAVDFRLGGRYDRFEAAIGVDDAARFQGSVVFTVKVDGVKRFQSALVRGGGPGPQSIRVPVVGGKKLSLAVTDGGDGSADDLADWGNARLVAMPEPLPRTHAHNDYRHAAPLFDALDHGFTSVEADVFLVDGKLLVGHGRSELDPGRTLEALYLDPLLERVRRGGGGVYRRQTAFYLLVDIKADGKEVYAALRERLPRYAEMLTRFTRDGIEWGAVTIVLSGDRPRSVLASEPARFAALDGRLPDLVSSDPAPSSLIPLVSSNWYGTFRWTGRGEMAAGEQAKLVALVRKAHGQGRLLRFWATPDVPAAWGKLLEAGVDLINTDDLEGLERFLRSR